MLRRLLAPIVVSPEVQPFSCASAAFLNEIINRDIIVGRYLERPLVILIRGWDPNVELTRDCR